MPLAGIEEAARDIRDGKMIIIVDDEDRENEGDLVCAAEKITPEIISFMAIHGRGLICMPLTEERCDELQLSPQTADNTSSMGTAFTISIEASFEPPKALAIPRTLPAIMSCWSIFGETWLWPALCSSSLIRSSSRGILTGAVGLCRSTRAVVS